MLHTRTNLDTTQGGTAQQAGRQACNTLTQAKEENVFFIF